MLKSKLTYTALLLFLLNFASTSYSQKPDNKTVQNEEVKKTQIEDEQQKKNCTVKDYDCLTESYSASIKANPEDSTFYFKRGKIYSLRGNYKKSISDFNKVIELNPDNQDALFKRGISYYYLGQGELSIKDFSEVIRLNPTDSATLVNRGIIYKSKHEESNAKQDYQKAIEILDLEIPLYSYNSGRYITRAMAYRGLRELDKAIADFYQAIQLNPTDYEIFFQRGILYLNQSNYALALDDLNKCIELEPDFAACYEERIKLFNKIGDTKKAREDMRKHYELSNKK